MESNTKEINLYFELGSYRQIFDDTKVRYEADKIFETTKDLKVVHVFCQKELKKPQIEKLKKEAKIIKRFEDSTFKNFIVKDNAQDKALKQAKYYVDNSDKTVTAGTNIIICGKGKCGTGKSRLASAITNELLEKIIPAKFISSTGMFSELRQSFDTTEFIAVDILIINDLGKQRNTEWSNEQLFTIVNSRYEKLKPVIITTEGSIDDLLLSFGEKGKSIIGRLIEKAIIITLNGKDYRWDR